MLNVTARQELMRTIVETLGVVVEEARLDFGEDGLSVRVVDPSHVAMIEANLMKSAFDSFDIKDVQMGLDIDKFKSVLTMAGKDEMVILENDKRKVIFSTSSRMWEERLVKTLQK